MFLYPIRYGLLDSYKLYSAIGFTLLLTILTALLISPHLKEEQLTDK